MAKNGQRADLVIHPLPRQERGAILEILSQCGNFTGEELSIAQELIDTWLDKPGQGDYTALSALLGGAVAGYVCFGPTPATQATWDLYWIAVAQGLQGSGIGKKLLQSAEVQIASRGGRTIVIETSSTEKYRPARGFYEKNGYALEARIRDFYRAGDHRLIYVKRMQAGGSDEKKENRRPHGKYRLPDRNS
ncbi:MAG: GNAT family N-acetyltransferase [Spirochaetia bacterium]|jgi:ribosomal protein S18 acetylase RimI-like enzyme|nr:GNAT family N-acetyltransferase [Spirochaetia bacterium]